MNFLLVYDRPAGQIVRSAEFASGDDALTARFAAEEEFRGNDDIEIVVLGAQSWDVVKRTHARYFYSTEELGRRLMTSIRLAT
jgi:hypothetical protein